MIGLLKDLKQWSASKPVQPTVTTFERSELGCVASIFLPPVPERRSRQPPLLSSRDAQELGLGGSRLFNEISIVLVVPKVQHHKSVYSFVGTDRCSTCGRFE